MEQYVHPALLLQAIADDYLVATALVFFIAGYDNVSGVLSWICFELALNPEVQEKVQQEIDEAFDEMDGKLPDYTTIQVCRLTFTFHDAELGILGLWFCSVITKDTSRLI